MKELSKQSKPMVLFFISAIIILALSIVFGLNGSSLASSEDSILRFTSKYPMDDELPYLPNYCQVRRMKQKYRGEGLELPAKLAPMDRAWERKLGTEVWASMHHYCAGLNRMNRYNRSKAAGFGEPMAPTKKQQLTLQYAIKEFHFVEGHYAKAGSPFYAMAISYHAIALWELGRNQDAFSTLQKAIRTMPNQPALYIQLAKFLMELGKNEEAKKVLQTGLTKTGGSKAIKDMLARLG